MARFLKDQQLVNLSFDEDDLAGLYGKFSEIQTTCNALTHAQPDDPYFAGATYIIRFDNKGHQVNSVEDFLRYFREAKQVERVVFTVETIESANSSRLAGRAIELRIDVGNKNNCSLTATADDRAWVDANFATVSDSLVKCRNRNGVIRTEFTQLLVQLLGVTLCVLLSVWGAGKLAPRLAIESPFVFGSIFVFLFLSNFWTFLHKVIMQKVDAAFPNVEFSRPTHKGPKWLLQAFIGAVVLWGIAQFGGFFLDILAAMVNKSA